MTKLRCEDLYNNLKFLLQMKYKSCTLLLSSRISYGFYSSERKKKKKRKISATRNGKSDIIWMCTFLMKIYDFI